MKPALSIGLLVVGVILLIYGWNASESFASEVKQTFDGTPTDRSIWLIAGGALLAIVGLAGIARRPK